MKVVVTGAGGLIGWHAAVRLHAKMCASTFRGEPLPWDAVFLDHAKFDNDATLDAALDGAAAVLHFAGVNRGPEAEVEAANPAIAHRLVEACNRVGIQPHVVYSNSIHARSNTPYGRSKKRAANILAQLGGPYTELVLPHIFGEGARPRYNNVTATFIEAIIAGERPEISSTGSVNLLHAGAAAQSAIDAVMDVRCGELVPEGRETTVAELYELLANFHTNYQANCFPDLRDNFTLDLFNSYRTALYPNGFPRPLKLNTDARGTLFEAVKGGGGGQTFLSTTEPGVSRGDHFHLRKVERFLVVKGEAIIRIRRVLDNRIWEYRVSGEQPSPVDMPTLHTHSIENVGSEPLMTLFWAHELFDPNAPDTYFDPVLKG